jgi:hypothetical protein
MEGQMTSLGKAAVIRMPPMGDDTLGKMAEDKEIASDILKGMIVCSQSNPGAMSVFLALHEFINDRESGNFLRKLIISLRITGTPAPCLWSFYKKREYDVETTMADLERWFNNSVQQLDLWDQLQ